MSRRAALDVALGARLREHREIVAKLSLTEVSSRLRRNPATLSRYETGDLPMRVSAFVAFCKAVGVAPEVVLAGLSDGSRTVTSDALTLARAFDSIRDKRMRSILSGSIHAAAKAGRT